MYVRYGALNGARQIDIKLTLHIGRQTGLHTDLSCPQINRLLNAAYDLFHWQEVALFAAIGTAECAKAAMFHTHIREIDIAVDHVSDQVADLPAPQFIGCEHSCMKIRPAGFAKVKRFLPADLDSVKSTRQDCPDIAVTKIKGCHSAPCTISF